MKNLRLLRELAVNIFNNFTDEELGWLLEHSNILSFSVGQEIVTEGDTGKEFYVILRGKVKVEKKMGILKEVVQLATMGSGQVFGELGIVDGGARSATIVAAEDTEVLVVDGAELEHNEEAGNIYEKLSQNLAAELSKKVSYLKNKLVKDEQGGAEDDRIIVPGSILALFGWRWLDIMYEVPFLSDHGYDAIKISPPQEFARRTGDPWWAIYQPVSYALSNFYGTDEEFIKMVDFCHGYGIKVYVDLVINHMADFIEGSESVGTNGTKYSRYHYGPLNEDGDYYEYDDFYHFSPESNKHITDEDYSRLEGIWHLEHYDFLNLPKVNLKSDRVIGILRKYIKFFLAKGIDGFRIDAAKHLNVRALEKLFWGLKTYEEVKPFLYQEYYASSPMGIDLYSFMEKYFRIGYVTSFRYGEILADAIRNKNNNLQKLLDYSFGSSWIHSPENRTVTVIDNHDTERMMPSMLNYKCLKNNEYVLAYVFMLAWPFGVPKIMSSFNFIGHDDPIPKNTVWQNGQFKAFDRGSGWVAQHRWQAIANMVLFRNKVKHAQGVSHVWAEGNQIAFSRVYQKPKDYVAAVGFVVINATNKPLVRRFETGLPAGSYYNLIASQLTLGRMEGKLITVENYGTASIEVAPFDAVVMVKDYML